MPSTTCTFVPNAVSSAARAETRRSCADDQDVHRDVGGVIARVGLG